MTRGAVLNHPLELVLLVQRSLTILLSGYNAFYFATYRSRHGRRRLGAIVLTFINLAIAAESLAFGLLPLTLPSRSIGFTAGSQLVAASLSLAVALTMAVLILRHHVRRR